MPQKKRMKDLLVVSDLDGTLVPYGGDVNNCSGDVVKLFTMLGGCFTIATGRNIESTRRFIESLELNYPAIVYNGAAIYDYNQGCTLYSRFLPKGEIVRALREIRDHFPSVGAVVMAENHRAYVTNATQSIYGHLDEEGYGFILADESMLSMRWYKCLLVAPNQSEKSKLHEFVKSRSYIGFDLVDSASCNLEFVPEGVSKGEALVELTKILQKRIEDTVMIGDYYNDVEALKIAGYAVVPCDAPSDIQKIADRIVLTSAEGGVAEYLYDVIRDYT